MAFSSSSIARWSSPKVAETRQSSRTDAKLGGCSKTADKWRLNNGQRQFAAKLLAHPFWMGVQRAPGWHHVDRAHDAGSRKIQAPRRRTDPARPSPCRGSGESSGVAAGLDS